MPLRSETGRPRAARSTARHCLVAALLLLGGCANLPDAREIERAAIAASAKAPAAKLPSDAALRQAVGGGEDLAFIRDVTRIESVVARRPLVAGNRVQLLKDGPVAHGAQLAAIRRARHSVHLMVYLLTEDEVGQQYATALRAAAQRGVQVRLIRDGLGGADLTPEFLAPLRTAGVELREFNSVNPLKEPRLWRVTRRNHRKILVVDGRVAFTGGINITDDYAGSSSGRGRTGSLEGSGGSSRHSRFSGRSQRGWRDTQVQVEGPAVAQFQQVFVEYWNELGDPVPADPRLFPALRPVGGQFVRLVTDQGQDLLWGLVAPANAVAQQVQGGMPSDDTRIYATYLAAIQAARSRVWITQAYFAPNNDFVDALREASARGVDVRLLMPGESDVPLLLYAGRAFYTRLLEAGIRLYEYRDTTVLHAKTAVLDGVWSTVGSANLDYRSFIVNDEANAIIIGREFGQQMERMFEDDLANAREIRLEEWRQRPWSDRVKEKGAAAMKFLL